MILVYSNCFCNFEMLIQATLRQSFRLVNKYKEQISPLPESVGLFLCPLLIGQNNSKTTLIVRGESEIHTDKLNLLKSKNVFMKGFAVLAGDFKINKANLIKRKQKSLSLDDLNHLKEYPSVFIRCNDFNRMTIWEGITQDKNLSMFNN